MTTETNTLVHPALLFMPDISGFTEFVSNTEIIHAQSIIQEVLGLIIESNQINMEVGEIEGDAIFFYRIGEPPALDHLLEQVQMMFTKFHQHLQMYEQQRICPCQACSSAAQLKLKIIAHFGNVAGYEVKTHRKLFGKDVIILHRLLKNNLNKKEYALLTNPLVERAETEGPLPGWFYPEEAREHYDVGEVVFKVSDLIKLKEQLPEAPLPELFNALNTKIVFAQEEIIPAAADKVFGAIFDLMQRPKWMDGVRSVEMVTKHLINRVGTMHRCIVRHINPVIITEYANIGNGHAELVEMDKRGFVGCRYRIESTDTNETKLRMEMLVKKNPLLLAFFNLFMKTKTQRKIVRSIENLKEYCRPGFVNTQMTVNNLN